VAKTQKTKKPTLNVLLTSLSLREIKKIAAESEKINHIDVTKIISENFGSDEELNDIRYWIVNQIIVKKIEGFRTSKAEKIFITLKEPDKSSIRSFKELMKDNKISPVLVEIYLP
jgi:hypothetical protein